MELKSLLRTALPVLAVVGCHAADGDQATGEATAYVGTTTTIPPTTRSASPPSAPGSP
jgi:hypothetical protein